MKQVMTKKEKSNAQRLYARRPNAGGRTRKKMPPDELFHFRFQNG